MPIRPVSNAPNAVGSPSRIQTRLLRRCKWLSAPLICWGASAAATAYGPTPGKHTFNVPSGVTSLQMEDWGAGGNGSEVGCCLDTGDLVIRFRRSNGCDMINANFGCNGSASTNLNVHNVVPVGSHVGMWVVFGSAKSISVGFKFTTAY